MISQCKPNPPVGVINYIYLLLGIAVAVFNLTDQLIKGQSPLERWVYTAPYAFVGLVLFFFRYPILESIAYLLVGCYTTIFTFHPADFSGVTFFVISLSLVRFKKYWVVLLALAVFCMPLKSLHTGGTVIQALQMIVVFTGTGALYYLRVYKRNTTKRIPDLTAQENEFIHLLSIGKSGKEAAGALGVPESNRSNFVKRILKKADANSTNQLMYLYGTLNSNE